MQIMQISFLFFSTNMNIHIYNTIDLLNIYFLFNFLSVNNNEFIKFFSNLKNTYFI